MSTLIKPSSQVPTLLPMCFMSARYCMHPRIASNSVHEGITWHFLALSGHCTTAPSNRAGIGWDQMASPSVTQGKEVRVHDCTDLTGLEWSSTGHSCWVKELGEQGSRETSRDWLSQINKKRKIFLACESSPSNKIKKRKTESLFQVFRRLSSKRTYNLAKRDLIYIIF